MRTCNRLDLQTPGSQPIMPKNLCDHCFGGLSCSLCYYAAIPHLIPINGLLTFPHVQDRAATNPPP